MAAVECGVEFLCVCASVDITDVGARLLADAIKSNPSITQLQLSNNQISDGGAAALAEIIRNSTSLKKVRAFTGVV
jgi:Ran GTPase-activating protein (RanGAP) involved in mRNA processing and transport